MLNVMSVVLRQGHQDGFHIFDSAEKAHLNLHVGDLAQLHSERQAASAVAQVVFYAVGDPST